MLRLATLFALLLAPSAAAQVSVCTTEWTNAAGGDWNDAANWSGAAVPGPTDDACVTLDGTYTVTNNTAPQIRVNSLTFGAASGTQTLDTDEGLAIAAPSTIGANGRWEWRIGALSGGATLTNNGFVEVDGFFNGALRTITGLGTELVNAGTLDWLDDQLHLVDDGAFTNTGLLTKTAGGVSAAQLTFDGADTGSRLFTNTGTIDVRVGQIDIDVRSRTDGATLTAALGAALEFGGGGTVTHTFAGTTTGAPVGALRMASGAQFAAEDGATWDVGGAGVVWDQADLVGGEALTNAGLIRIEGFFNGVQRSISGSGTTLLNTGTVDWVEDSVYLLDGGALTNAGTITKTVLGVRSGNLYVDAADPNPGLFTNTGTIDVQVGQINLDTPSRTDGAVLAVASGATLTFGGGDAVTHTFAGTTTGAPAGALRMAGDAQFAAEAGAVWDIGGAGVVWDQADLVGGEALTNQGLLAFDGFFNFVQRSIVGPGTALVNTGTIDWRDDDLYLVDDAAFTNTGLITKTAAGVAAAALFASGVDTGSRLFTNTGTIDVQVGQIDIDVRSRTDGATLSVAPDAVLEFSGGEAATHTFAGTTGGAPAGALRMAGDAQFAAEAGAVWDIGGAGVVWGQADLVGGERLTNAGRIVVQGFFNFARRTVAGAGTVLANAGTLEWNDDEIALVAGGALENTGRLVRTPGGVAGTVLYSTDATGTFTNAGTVEVRGNTLNIDVPMDHQAVGVVTGFSAFDIAGSTFTHLGDTAPGSADSTGVLVWSGQPWAPPASATLFARIGGTVPGDDYDQLAVTGAATLAGTLQLDILDGFAPSVGDSYTVLTAASVTGTFDSVVAPPGYAFGVAYTAADVVVTVTAIGVTTELTGAEGWRMLAPSVAGQTFDGVVGALWTQGFPGADTELGGANVFVYDEATPGSLELGYAPPANQSDPFALGTGAFVFVYADDDQDGPAPPGFPKTLVQSGPDVTGAFAFAPSYTPSGDPDDDGWTLIGNPYAAGLDWTDPAWTRANVSSTVYAWDPAVADYREHNTLLGDLPDGVLAPAQGAWVQAMDASPELVASASARTAPVPFLGRQAEPEAVVFRLAPADPEAPARASAHVAFLDGAADGRDRFDAFDLAPLAQTALALWTGRASDGVPLAIQALAPADGARLDLGAAAWADGAPAPTDLVLTWELPGGLAAELRDRVTGETLDLQQAEAYAFQNRPGAARLGQPAHATRQTGGEERFELRLGAAAVDAEASGPELSTELLAPRPNPVRGAARVPFTLADGGAVRLSVVDLLGREVRVLVDEARAAGAHTAELRTDGLAAGVYLARLRAPGGTVAVQRLTVVR